ncbi:type II secretion system F family protein [Gammaproteobacteria bacterium]|nr:type II secretion system F family protein [Gammaproteobacteria bacterium]
MNDTTTPTPRFASSFSAHKLTATELAYFSRQLAALLTADISLTDALTTLGESDRTKIRKLVALLLRDINSGESLSRAMEAHPQTFNKFYVTLIREGEAAASLPLVLMQLAAEIERKMHLSRKVKQALLQPTLILLAAMIAVTFYWFLSCRNLPHCIQSKDKPCLRLRAGF